MTVRRRVRDAITGRFARRQDATDRPETTVEETVEDRRSRTVAMDADDPRWNAVVVPPDAQERLVAVLRQSQRDLHEIYNDNEGHGPDPDLYVVADLLGEIRTWVR